MRVSLRKNMNDLCLFSLDFLIYPSIIRYILKAKALSFCTYKMKSFCRSSFVIRNPE